MLKQVSIIVLVVLECFDALHVYSEDPWYRATNQQSQPSSSLVSFPADIGLYTRQWNRTYLITSDLEQVFSIQDDDDYVKEIVSLRKKGIIKLCDGLDHSVAISVRGSVWLEDKRVDDRFKLIKLNDAIDIVCGQRSAFVIDENLQVYFWGQLGPNELYKDSNLIVMSVFDGYHIKSVSITGEDKIAVLSVNNIAFVWNSYNSLNNPRPQQIKSFLISSITANWDTIYFLTIEHTILILKADHTQPQLFYRSHHALKALYTNRFDRQLFLVAEAENIQSQSNVLFRAEMNKIVNSRSCHFIDPIQIYNKPVADIFFHYRSRAHSNGKVCLSFMIKLSQHSLSQKLSLW